MNVERMHELVRYLEALPIARGSNGGKGGRFNMNTYGRKNRSGNFCGCAGGWACLNPKFNEQGLKNSQQLNKGDCAPYVPCFNVSHGQAALRDFFELSHGETWTLFGAHLHRTLQDEINLLRQFCSEKGHPIPATNPAEE